MSMAKAIALKADKTQELIVLAKAFVTSFIVIELVSLLIGGVVRPMLTEW